MQAVCGERHAAKRFMAKLRQDHPHLQCMVTDSNGSRAENSTHRSAAEPGAAQRYIGLLACALRVAEQAARASRLLR